MPEPYQPSNSSEGDEFMARWCNRCACEPDADPQDVEAPDGCPILAATFISSPGDEDYPAEWVHGGEDEEGICTAFVERPADWDGVPLDPEAVAAKRDAYAALPRDPATGRPIIA